MTLAPVHKHAWTEFEAVPDQYATVERHCTTCDTREQYKLALSTVAQTRRERNRVRGATRYRRGYALTPRGQTQLTHKQRRRNVQDQHRD